MAQRSAIEWTDATVNFWWGCTKVGPGCDHCYAETWSKRTGGSHWGHGVPRRKIASAAALIHRLDNDYANWAADRECGLCGPHASISRRVFIQSMSDLFDLEVPVEWFAEAWGLIKVCNRLELQIVTKRISAVEKRLAEIGETTWPKHAGLIITVVDQDEANRDVPRLLALKAKLGIPWVGLSCEPLLGWIDLHALNLGTPSPSNALRGVRCVPDDSPEGYHNEPTEKLDWVIVGGESGAGARPMHPDWVRSLRDHCAASGVPFLFKQWGNHVPIALADNSQKFSKFYLNGRGFSFHQVEGYALVNVGKKGAGRKLDGVEHNSFPKVPA